MFSAFGESDRPGENVYFDRDSTSKISQNDVLRGQRPVAASVDASFVAASVDASFVAASVDASSVAASVIDCVSVA